MKGISGFFALCGLVLAVAGAAGWGPPWGGDAGVVAVVDVSPSAEPPEQVPPGAIRYTDSRIGPALQAARGRGARRIRLFTDGCDPGGAPTAPPGVPVDVVLLPRRDRVALLALRAPDVIPTGVDFAVEVVLGRTEGPRREAADAVLELRRDGERVGAPRRVRLERGQRRRVLFRDRVDREGPVRYRAHLQSELGAGGDLEGLVKVGERPLVLAVPGPGPAGPFRTLKAAPGEVAALLGDPSVRAAVDAILLDGPLPDAAAQEAVARCVEGGAGLVVLGGAGFAGGALEKTLPLTDRPPEGRAALLLLDFSGSMHERKDELLAAVEELRMHFAPTDRLAFIAFRDVPVASSGWEDADRARWDLAALVPQGNTELRPALALAARRLDEAGKARRRCLVVSDGQWGDRKDPRLKEQLASMAGVHLAALFLGDDVPPEAEALFPVHFRAGADLAAGLLALEDSAADRTVRRAEAVRAPAPEWLAGAVPPAGTYADLVRLFPKGEGEQIPLATRDAIPLVGAWRRVGKVVVCAPRVEPAPLLLAVLREGRELRLAARREGHALVLTARGSGGAPFRVEDVLVEARPAGPDAWQARVESVGEGPLRVACGGATLLVPPAAAGELEGLSNRPDVAAAIATASGGSLLEAGAPLPEGGGPAPEVLLLLAAGCVLLSALLRRRAG